MFGDVCGDDFIKWWIEPNDITSSAFPSSVLFSWCIFKDKIVIYL